MIFLAPVRGVVKPLSDSPDAVFADKMLGDGIIVAPSDKTGTIVSPVTGLIKALNENLHALVIEEKTTGVEVLIHVGINTVSLAGEGFELAKTGGFLSKKIKVGSHVIAGQPLLTVDFEFIRSKELSDLVMIIITNHPDSVVKAEATGVIEAGQPLFSMSDAVLSPAVAATSNDVSLLKASEWITIINPTGLHARPTARLVTLTKSVVGTVIIEKEDGTQADAKSTTAIMSMGLHKGEKARFYAPNVSDLKPIVEAVRSGLGEGPDDVQHEAPKIETKHNFDTSQQTIDLATESVLQLNIASPGVAVGKAVILSHEERDLGREAIGSLDEEQKFLMDALKQAEKDIESEMGYADAEAKEILEAHLSFLTDPSFVTETQALIKEGSNAAWAWQQVAAKNAAELAASDNAYLAARAADVKDVARRVLNLILGEEDKVEYGPDSIVLTEEFLPSDISRMTANVIATATVLGTPTGHAAIMMRNRGIGSLYGAPKSLMKVAPGSMVIVDASEGKLILNPTETTLLSYQDRMSASNKVKAQNLADAHKPCVTTDGHKVEISGNICDVAEAKLAVERGAEGFGLVRSEFLFENRPTAPTENDQIGIYQPILDVAGEHPVVVRLLDAGGDKPISYVRAHPEDNPLLGVRGVRLFVDNEDLLRTQLRALLRCEPRRNLHIMIPMIALVSEIEMVRVIMLEEADKLGIAHNDLPKLGAMAETPAVCVMSEQFAKHVDFFSVGSNDLTQYTMAMDRTNSRLAAAASAANPGVLGLIKTLCEGAAKHNVHVAVCGGAASDPITAALFIGLGVQELAVSGVAVPQIKALMRSHSFVKLQEVAQKALACETEDEVKKMVSAALNLG